MAPDSTRAAPVISGGQNLVSHSVSLSGMKYEIDNLFG